MHSDKLLSQIAVAITPVQTLGVVRFSRIEENSENGEPRFFFRKTSFRAPYSPKDVEEVLRYILSFCIKKYLDDMPWYKRFFKFTQPFKDAIRKMATERKETKGGFDILQGHDLLNLKS